MYRYRGRTRGGPVLALLLCCLLLLVSGCAQSVSRQNNTVHRSVPAGSGQLTYVAIGASDTFGYGTSDPYADNWPADLAQRLGSNVHLVNLGIPSIRLHDALRLELPVALDVHPGLVTIWLAVNDLADKVPVASYAHDLDLMLSRLQAGAPHVRIAIANVPDLTLLPYFIAFDQHWLQQQITAYNNAIAQNVARHHVILVDLTQQSYNLAQHPEYISSDGLHPSAAGYIRLAELFYQALR